MSQIHSDIWSGVNDPHIREKKKYLRYNYGAGGDLPLDYQIIQPKTPTEGLKEAGKYLFEQEDRGFIRPTTRPRDDPLSYYAENSRILSFSPKAKENPRVSREDIERIKQNYAHGREKKFAIEFDCVKKSVKTLSLLLFTVKNEQILAIDNFYQRVVDLSSGIHFQMLFDGKEHHKLQLMKITNEFIVNVRKICSDIIRRYIKAGEIVLDSLTANQRIEFLDLMPRVEAPPPPPQPVIHEHKEEIDPKKKERVKKAEMKQLESTFERYSALPSIYRPSSEILNDHVVNQNHQQLQRFVRDSVSLMSNVKLSPPKTAPLGKRKIEPSISAPNALNQNLIKSSILGKKSYSMAKIPKENLDLFTEEKSPLLWEITDPLYNIRGGTKFDPMKEFQIDVPCIDASYDDGEIELPFKLGLKIEEKLPPPPPPPPKVEVTIDPREIERESLPTIEFSRYSPYIPEMELNNDPEFTDKSPLEIIKENSTFFKGSDSNVFKELEETWESLGFTTQQKLGMVIKYSESLSSISLSESIVHWNNAKHAVLSYDRCYIELKDYLKFPYQRDSNDGIKETTLKDIENDFDEKEALVKSAAKKLKEMCDDDLLFKRRTINDIMASRRLKIFHLKHKIAC